MASPNNPKSTAELIMEYSQARVISHGGAFITGYDANKRPIWSRPLTDESVKRSLIKSLKK